jgi:hypothetical protein
MRVVLGLRIMNSIILCMKGDFYLQHVDQFQNNSSRKYSMISYLVIGLQTVEIMIHQENRKKITHQEDCFF